jgi:DNA mismatch repair protein MutS
MVVWETRFGEEGGGRGIYSSLMAGDPRDTPAMQQYYRFKREHPGCILLFRIGDFYEAFDEDAVTISRALGLTLTKRTEGLPMAGIPHHQLEVYLKRLIDQRFKVAVGEQVEEASQAKGLIRREVTRVVTPGTIVEDSLVDDEASITTAAVAFLGSGEDSHAALAVVEASTGEFLVMDATAEGIADELARRRVREVLFAPAADGSTPPPRIKKVLEALGLSGTPRPTWHFRSDESREAVLTHFGVKTVSGFGLREDDPAVIPAGVVIRYLRETQTPGSENTSRGALAPRATLAHLRPPRREEASASCLVDAVSLRALEVERVLRQGVGGMAGIDRSLVGLFLGTGKAAACRTAMGKRLLRDWLCRPLAERSAIEARHAAVSLFVSDRRVADELGSALDGVQDVARIVGRLALDRATPRDLVALAQSIARGPKIATTLEGSAAVKGPRAEITVLNTALAPVADVIAKTCVETPPPHLREGGLIRDGVDAGLDESRLLQRDAGAWLAAYQERLARELDLPGIKVGFNKIFGYYIELTASQSRNAAAAIAKLERKQSLKNAERFTTPELREFERKVTTAESRSVERERQIFAGLCDKARGVLGEIQRFATAIAEIDTLLAFAVRSAAKGWARPEMVDESVLHIEHGRHPVLEEVLASDFVPNDVSLSLNEGDLGEGVAARIVPAGTREVPGTLALITGPNMAGKSTFIRQVALIVLLAHAGCFVPANRATIGVTDRIFTRIGADDALHAGQSTFMVEMTETANILNNATPRSLVVLDEIGRGTSTLDGLSLAWAIAEHLAGEGEKSGPRTLFATHYHELTDLEERLPGRVKNLHVAVREWTTPGGHQEIVFLHRILPGRTDQSYGVHVAKLAGIPMGVIARSREVLESLAVQHGPGTGGGVPVKPSATNAASDGQMMLFTQYLPHPAVAQLREVKLESLSPMQAFDMLRELREQATKG